MPTLRIYTGMDIVEQVGHPVKQFEKAKNTISDLVKNDIDLNISSNSPDFVSALYYISKKYDNIVVKFYVDNVEVETLDDVFASFNKFYDLLDEVYHE